MQLCDLKETHVSNVMYHFLDSKYVCVGSPTLNSKFLPTVSAFLTYMTGMGVTAKITLLTADSVVIDPITAQRDEMPYEIGDHKAY